MKGPHGAVRHGRRWWALIVVAKVLIVAGLVILPSEFAVALGAAHGVALSVGVAVAVAVLVIRRRHRSTRQVSPDHGHPHHHDDGQEHGQDSGPDHERGHGAGSVPNGRPSTPDRDRRERGTGR